MSFRHLLVIGAQRCGTSYLATILDAHPDVTMARPARPEPKVFLSDELTARGATWYRDTYFGHAAGESVLGEKSTSYLEDAGAARRAASMLGTPIIVAQLRDPVARAVSNWRFSSANGLEERDLGTALEDNLSTSRAWDAAATSVSPYAYLERGHYVDYLLPWMDVFPDPVITFLEETRRDANAIARLYAAIGVDAAFRPAVLARVNQSTGAEPALEPSLVRRLRDHFREDDARLAALLGRRLPWSPA